MARAKSSGDEQLSYVSNFSVKLGGSNLDTAIEEKLLEIIVDHTLYLPDMVVLRLDDTGQEAMNNTQVFDVGKELEIKVYNTSIFKGEVTSLESDFGEDGAAIFLVRGYDKSHRLHRGRKRMTYLEMTDSDLVSQIAGGAGLQADVDSTKVTHKYIYQDNQTDMEFLQTRAHSLGYHVYVDDGKLCFKAKPPSLGQPIDLEWGINLYSFRPRLNAAHQVDKVIVQGWDPSKKEAIREEVTSPSSTDNQGGVQGGGGATAKKAFGAAEMVVVNSPIAVPTEAKEMAQGLLDAFQRSFVQAEGVCEGNPKIKAGAIVNIQGVGQRFGGKYAVTEARHLYSSRTNQYEVEFKTGQQVDTFARMLESSLGEAQGQGLFQSVVVGVVTNVDDPDDLCRVKVKFPWMSDTDESTWARLAMPMAGPDRGLLIIPEVNDEVLVAFEHGDVRFPYVIGALWNGSDAPPMPNSEATSGGVVNTRMLKSRAGHVIILDDTDGAEQIIIRDKTEKNEIIVDSAENTITINVDQDFVVNAGNKVSFTNESNRDIVSKGDMTIKTDSGAKLTIQSASDVTVKAQSNMKLEATGNLELKATGQLKIQGAQVSVAGDAMTEIKGGVVKIN
jgi:phage protein D/phage baseplate assembly protein gpV